MQWGNPDMLPWLWLLLPLAALLFGLARRRERQLARLMDAQVLAQGLPATRLKRHRARLLLWLIAVALVGVALARPQWGEKWIEVRHMGLDILVVLDTSNSMLAEDIRPNRLGRAKLGIRDLIGQLRGDRIGLIPFAGDSYLYCPLTADYGAFMMMLDDVRPGLIPRGGTAVEQALRLAVNTFDDHLLADRVIILVTDGEDHEGNPLNVLDEMRRRNIRLFAVGVGTPDGDLIPVTDERGRTSFLRDREGNIVRTRLQEDMLERLATRTGGMYVRATPGDFGLEQIYQQGIAPLQRDMLETEMIRAYEDRFGWFLGLALLLLVVEALLRDGSHRGGAPVNGKGNGNGGATQVIAVALLWSLVAGPVFAESPDAAMKQGVSAFDQQQFEDAALAFREAAERAQQVGRDPARAWFNYANALFEQGRFEDAARVYQDALRSTDLDVQQSAHFNRGNALLAEAVRQAEGQAFDAAKTFTERAVDSYRNALTLRPTDRDAKINHELADRFREELEEILAQQPQQPQAQPEPGEGEDDQEDQEQDQDQQDQDGEQEPSPDQDQTPPSEEPQDGDQDGEDEAQAQPMPAGQDEQQEQDTPRPESMEEMTEDEAMLLLDALRDEEQETRDQMRLRLGQPQEVEKDW